MASSKAPAFPGFNVQAIRFLVELTENNDRDWFKANQTRYEAHVREPARAFIRAMAPRLKKLSPHLVASDDKVGGSMMRPQRDTRFGSDKTPYKTNVGIQFRHVAGKDVHAPGLYVHFDPAEVFIGVGLWHPDPIALAKIRAHLDERQGAWKKVVQAASFSEHLALGGDSLSRPPKGYAADHPLVQDLKRKDFIAVSKLSHKDLLGAGFLDAVETRFKAGKALMRFLCEAVELPF
ncbi:MAG: DUF2461 domain-containing protein [Myxococcales bacterium]